MLISYPWTVSCFVRAFVRSIYWDLKEFFALVVFVHVSMVFRTFIYLHSYKKHASCPSIHSYHMVRARKKVFASALPSPRNQPTGFGRSPLPKITEKSIYCVLLDRIALLQRIWQSQLYAYLVLKEESVEERKPTSILYNLS